MVIFSIMTRVKISGVFRVSVSTQSSEDYKGFRIWSFPTIRVRIKIMVRDGVRSFIKVIAKVIVNIALT